MREKNISMKAVPSKRFSRVALCCVLLLAAGTTFFFFARLDISSGLLKQSGTVRYFSDRVDGGMSIILQKAGRDAWGFFEWPQRGLYGTFSGLVAEKGFFEVDISQGNAARATLVMPSGNPGKALEMRVKLGPAEAITELLKRGGDFPFSRVETYAGAFGADGNMVSPLRRLTQLSSIEDGGRDPGQSSFFLDALEGSGRPASFLDLSLRRGNSPLSYARGYWNRFGQAAAAAAGGNFPLRAFAERQYLVAVSGSLMTTATERYVFDGGAHGTTTTTFCILDLESGKSLAASDIFKDGWKEPVGAKLQKEALRVFSRNEEQDGRRKLSDYGLFEDKIEASSGVFLCRSGVGFHYDHYELGPYAAGDFMFVIPWEDLKDVLKNPDLGESFK